LVQKIEKLSNFNKNFQISAKTFKFKVKLSNLQIFFELLFNVFKIIVYLWLRFFRLFAHGDFPFGIDEPKQA